MCRLRRQQCIANLGRARSPGVSQRRLFRPDRAVEAAAAATIHARRSHRDPFRSRWRHVPIHAGDRSSTLRQTRSSIRIVPGGRIMTSLLWILIAIQVVMGVFDTFYHHELTERLAWRPSQRYELQLHSLRNMLYALLFLVLGWLEVHGVLAVLIIAVLVAEIVITLMDFVEEDMSRKLPASERINHTLLAINYGAILVLLLPVLLAWAMQPTGFKSAYTGLLSIIAAASAVGAALCGVRDFTASRRLARMTSAPAAGLVERLPARQTVLVTGATGFIGSRLVASLTAAGHQVIALVRNPAKADMLRPPITLITSLDQIPAESRIDTIVNLAGEPIGKGLWTEAKRRNILGSRIK